MPFGADPEDFWAAAGRRGRRRRGILFSLVFLVFPLAELLSDPPHAARLALALAGFACFAGLYVAVTLWPAGFGRPQTLVPGLLALLGLAAALTFEGSAHWLPLFVYVAVATGIRLGDHAWPWLVVVAAVSAACGALTDYDAGTTLSIALTVFGIGAILSGYARLWAANAELRAARDEVARLAAAEERLRIARDLHDLLGHSLSLVALKTELARRLIPSDPSRAAAELADVEAVTRRSLSEVREAVAGYRAPSLAAELASARHALASAGIEPRVEAPADVALPAALEALLAWTVREGATNVVRHSGARHCTLRLAVDETSAAVEVIDDGVGPAPADREHDGSGLAGLAERASSVGASLEAGASGEHGFRLRVSAPLVSA